MIRARLVLALALLCVGLLSAAATGDLQARASLAAPTATYRVFLPMISRQTYSATFPEANALILGSCPPVVHDRYLVIGPDGNQYRTWHPVTVPIDAGRPSGPKCSFAHEHGDPPHPAGAMPAFGYASHVHGMDSEIAAHPGFKVFTHYADGRSGLGSQETDYRGLPIDFTLTIHQGSAGKGRLTIQHHSLEYWSRYQGRVTHVFTMADTGGLIGKGCPGGGPEPARVVVDHCDVAYEMWPFAANIGGAWNTGAMFAAVTNPMNHLHGSLPCADAACTSAAMISTSEEICGHTLVGCDAKLPFGQHGAKENVWLGHFRTIHEPDWRWTNAGGAEVFCTNALGIRQSCGLPGSIRQQVAAVSVSNDQASMLLRTNNEAGWAGVMYLPLGAPGGN
jgi:hypothetical protein